VERWREEGFVLDTGHKVGVEVEVEVGLEEDEHEGKGG
jgi:hypothetical protein